MTKYYKATFSDGFVAKRSTSREYTHAWRVGSISGFARNAKLAAKAAASWTNPKWASEPRDIAPVVEITAKEYRSK